MAVGSRLRLGRFGAEGSLSSLGQATNDQLIRVVDHLLYLVVCQAAVQLHGVPVRLVHVVAGFPRVRRILAPTLLIWGERDPALVPQLAAGLERGVPNLRVERIPEATHWVQHEVPDRVNELLAGFLA